MSAPEPDNFQDWMRLQEKRVRQQEIRMGAETLDIPLDTNWGSYDNGFEIPRMRISGPQVQFFGMLTRKGFSVASTTAPQVIGQLPVGWRPALGHLIPVYGNGGSGGHQQGWFTITPSGQIQHRWLTANTYTVDTTYISMNPVVYLANG